MAGFSNRHAKPFRAASAVDPPARHAAGGQTLSLGAEAADTAGRTGRFARGPPIGRRGGLASRDGDRPITLPGTVAGAAPLHAGRTTSASALKIWVATFSGWLEFSATAITERVAGSQNVAAWKSKPWPVCPHHPLSWPMPRP